MQYTQIFGGSKNRKFHWKKFVLFIILLKTLIMGTR